MSLSGGERGEYFAKLEGFAHEPDGDGQARHFFGQGVDASRGQNQGGTGTRGGGHFGERLAHMAFERREVHDGAVVGLGEGTVELGVRPHDAHVRASRLESGLEEKRYGGIVFDDQEPLPGKRHGSARAARAGSGDGFDSWPGKTKRGSVDREGIRSRHEAKVATGRSSHTPRVGKAYPCPTLSRAGSRKNRCSECVWHSTPFVHHVEDQPAIASRGHPDAHVGFFLAGRVRQGIQDEVHEDVVERGRIVARGVVETAFDDEQDTGFAGGWT